MCEAATAVTVGTMLAGAVIKSRAQGQAGSVNAAILEGNAALADKAAGDAILRGDFGAERATLQGGKVASAQKSAYAAAGVDASSGSPTTVAGDTAAMTALDAAIIKSNAQREAWGYSTKAQQFRSQAQRVRAAASGNATETVLAGISGAARISIPKLVIAGQEGSGDEGADAFDAAGMMGET